MYSPTLEEFRRAASRGTLIPVYRELLADGDTPVSAYAALAADPAGKGAGWSFLLESVVGGQTWAAYSFVGVTPRAIFTWDAGRAHVTWVGDGTEPVSADWDVADPCSALAEIMSEWKPVTMPGLPRFWGGAVGWIAYDAARAFEDLPARAKDDLGLPAVCMVLTDTVVIFDNLRQTIKVVATAHVASPDRADRAYARALERIDAVIARLQAPRARLASLEPPSRSESGKAATPTSSRGESVTSSFGEAAFCHAVAQIQEYIVAGDAFQVVLSQRLAASAAGVDPLDVYRSLRVINPSPYMFHLDFGPARLTGASPETLVRLSDGKVEVRPIAGTRPRGATSDEDERLANELSRDPKELAEHLMLIDLGRNDVGRVSAVGSVRVTEQMVVERFSHVMHLTSHVEGALAPGRTWVDVVRAAFPAGTLSGAPKIRAMEIIDELEPHRRGLYGGAVGYVSYTGNVDFAIAIRTLVSVGNSIYVQAGAGVVADSDPTAEHQETLNKAKAVLRAVEMARTRQRSAG